MSLLALLDLTVVIQVVRVMVAVAMAEGLERPGVCFEEDEVGVFVCSIGSPAMGVNGVK